MADENRTVCRRNHTEISRFSTYSNINSSFSATLLEEICRSIDQGGEEVVMSMRKKRDEANVRTVFKSEEDMANYQRACMIEKWMEKKVGEKSVVRGKTGADFQRRVKTLSKDRLGSSSSSSDSSCSGGGFFSSSEGEAFPVIQRPKPVRIGGELEKSGRNSETDRRERLGLGDQLGEKSKEESGFLKTKSRALKIYGDLKKAKQPISPGGKVAAFLNSLFAAGSLKKHKIAAACGDDRDSPSLKSANTSCSSASSFSRSCLSKTTTSSKSSVKRSVRFSRATVIADEACEQKSSHQRKNNDDDDSSNVHFIKTAIDEELIKHIMEKNRQVEEAARDFLMNYHKKDQTECDSDQLPFDHLDKIDVENRGIDRGIEEEDDLDEDFDAASCASSDLFELDNLSAIGMERYREELPVYETTHLDQIQTMQMV